MNESKFIELLNLYVDHQISPADAALLETEVRSNPERRRVYRQYCQMQKACTELAASFRSQAPATEPKLAEFKPRRRASGAAVLATGLLAAAACVAVVLGVRSRFAVANPNSRGPVAVQLTPAAFPVARSVAARPALQPAIGPHLVNLRAQNADLADAAATTDQMALADWMNSIQMSSLPGAPADELSFDARATLQPDPRTYRTARPFKGKVEWTAFTFQK